jgi:hypothetical protein
LWLPVAGLALFFSLFPGLLVDIAHALGFQVASNAAMSLAIMGLLFVTFLQSIALARAKADIRDLAQRIALFEAGQRKDR